MNRYWLTPIICREPVIFGADRLCCEPPGEADALREEAHALHPRLLPMFKASLLLSDDEELCGSELVEADLAAPGVLAFDGNPLHISYCAEAFLDRLLAPGVSKDLVRELKGGAGGLSDRQLLWKRQWLEWLENGFEVILLREDGR